MAVLFRPFYPVDNSHWIPALRAGLGDLDLRIAPDCGDPSDIEYLIGWAITPEDKTAWPRLRAVLSLRAGLDRWFVGNANMPEGVALVRMIDPGLIAQMTEYVGAYVLRFHRELDRLECGGPEENWSAALIPTLAAERRIGIMGLGTLGQACAETLRPFGFSLSGWSRTPKTVPGVSVFAGPDARDAFLRQSDILVCLLPLTPETENILDARAFALMPRGACLINAARGRHVVDRDLIAALDSGHLRGAVLDVFREEPLPRDHPFRSHPKIRLTPHISAITHPITGTAALRRSLEALQKGEKPPGLFDPAQGY